MGFSLTSVADPDNFDTDPDNAFRFGMDPDPYGFNEVTQLNGAFN